MEWKQQFDIIIQVAKKKFLEEGREYSLKAFEDSLGLSRGKAHHWKKGQRPSADDLAGIARFLGLSPRWLLLGQGEPKEDKNDEAVESSVAPLQPRPQSTPRAEDIRELVASLRQVGATDEEIKRAVLALVGIRDKTTN